MTSSDPQTAPICTQCRYLTNKENEAQGSSNLLEVVAGKWQNLSLNPFHLLHSSLSAHLASTKNLRASSLLIYTQF